MLRLFDFHRNLARKYNARKHNSNNEIEKFSDITEETTRNKIKIKDVISKKNKVFI
tara:strand:- start:18345 stop:18512 length:168 start_codon:yes stop_codon:yes gene_type:complete